MSVSCSGGERGEVVGFRCVSLRGQPAAGHGWLVAAGVQRGVEGGHQQPPSPWAHTPYPTPLASLTAGPWPHPLPRRCCWTPARACPTCRWMCRRWAQTGSWPRHTRCAGPPASASSGASESDAAASAAAARAACQLGPPSCWLCAWQRPLHVNLAARARPAAGRPLAGWGRRLQGMRPPSGPAGPQPYAYLPVQLSTYPPAFFCPADRGELLHEMPPWMGGGEMIESVFLDHSTYAEPPGRFEAGTPAIAQACAAAGGRACAAGAGPWRWDFRALGVRVQHGDRLAPLLECIPVCTATHGSTCACLHAVALCGSVTACKYRTSKPEPAGDDTQTG